MIFCLISFLVTTVVGLLYPMYSSLKLITNKSEEKPQATEYQRWLTYWILFACISKLFFCDCCENEYLVFFEQILRSLLIAYLALPYTNGSLAVYDKVFKNGEETKDKIRGMLKNLSNKVCKCCSGKGCCKKEPECEEKKE